MAKKQYLDLTGLTTYDEEIKAHIDGIASGKANSSHNHAASNITSGTLSSDRLPTVPITKGGTGATTAAGALTNLGLTATAAELNKMDGVTATTTELNYVDGVTSNIQTQLDAKAPKSHASTATTYGAGTDANYGHVKLSDSTSSTSSTNGGIAATPAAVKTAYDLANSKANASHNHSASNITSGILPIERGGTGNSNGYVRAGAEEGSTIGTLATAEGRKVTASGSYCHAEGNFTEASGSSAHAEGQSSTASGIASHAEGNNATASGAYSHAEGDFTNASAKGAHAEGTYTLASSEYQHVQGKFNIEDKAGVYAHIVGNGTGTSARSNAHTLDWDGNAWFAGDVYVGGTSQDDAACLKPITYGTEVPTSAPSTGAGTVCFVEDIHATLPITEGGTGATSVDAARANLKLNHVGASACATGSISSVTFPSAGAIVNIPLTTWIARSDTNFEISDNGIECPYDGTVLVSGSVYVTTQAGYSKGCYIYKNGGEMHSQYLYTGGSGVVTSGVMLIPVSAGDIITMRARSSSTASSNASPNNKSTFLSVVYVD